MSTTNTTKNASQAFATSLTHDPSPVAMDAETFYHLGMLAVEIATEYLEGIPGKPVFRPMTPSERQLLLYQQLPEHGRSPEALFDFFERISCRMPWVTSIRALLPGSIRQAHPSACWLTFSPR